jgi:hypothetical protein
MGEADQDISGAHSNTLGSLTVLCRRLLREISRLLVYAPLH